jgi:hypothetical protein
MSALRDFVAAAVSCIDSPEVEYCRRIAPMAP